MVARLSRPMLESDWQARVIGYAELHGWRVFHPRPARIGNKIATWQSGHKGYPDLTLARDGVVLFVELKQDGRYPGPEQRKWRDAIGERWRLWRPVDWDAVQSELARPRRHPIRSQADEPVANTELHQCDSHEAQRANGGDGR